MIMSLMLFDQNTRRVVNNFINYFEKSAKITIPALLLIKHAAACDIIHDKITVLYRQGVKLTAATKQFFCSCFFFSLWWVILLYLISNL